MEEPTQNWLQLAQEDFDDSLYLYKAARHPNALYLMCQAIEKLLKAAQVEIAEQVPKKIHDLQKLAHSSGLPLSNEQFTFLKGLNKHYERVRYRDLRQAHYNSKAKVEPIIKPSKKIYLWILTTLKNH